MDTNASEFLLNGISMLIAKNNTRFRTVIPPGERLVVTLRLLATGETQRSLSFQFRIAQNNISDRIVEVCKAISAFLQPLVLKVPGTMKEWLEIEKNFLQIVEFPDMRRSMEKHVKIRPPLKSGSLYYNYKRGFQYSTSTC